MKSGPAHQTVWSAERYEADGKLIEWAHNWNPLHNDAQAMALVKKLGLDIHCREDMNGWYVGRGRLHEGLSIHADLNRAICQNVADIQAQ